MIRTRLLATSLLTVLSLTPYLARAQDGVAGRRVSVTLPECVPVERDVFFTILEVELGVELVEPRAKRAILVSMSCDSNSITIDVVNPETARSAGRVVELADAPGATKARLLALTTAELVESSRLEFDEQGKPIRGSGGPGVYDQPAYTQGVYVGLAASGTLGAPDVRAEPGLALRLEGAMFGTWRWSLGALASASSERLEQGEVRSALLAGELGVAKVWVADPWSVRVGPMVRVGSWRAEGLAEQGASGSSAWLPFVGVGAGARGAWSVWGPLRLDAGIELGYPVVGPAATVDGQRAFGLDGPWARVDLGIQIALWGS